MSLKRGATSDLNHENWEREEKPEEKGSFLQAPKEELQARIIKKAKRKLEPSEDGETSKSVFSGFTGFGKSSTVASATTVSSSISPFSFLSNMSSASASVTPSLSVNNSINSNTPSKPEIPSTTTEKEKTFQFNDSSVYYSKLKTLNQAVSDWIKQHVDRNPLCILSPIFNDYDKYLKEIQTCYKNDEDKSLSIENKTTPPQSELQATSSFKSPIFSAVTIPTASTSFNASFSSSKPEEKSLDASQFSKETTSSPFSKETNSSPFSKETTLSFASNKTSPSNALSTFSFGQKLDSKPLNTGFSFGATNKSLFGNIQPPRENTDENIENTEADEDEPPKVEFTPVEEKDSVYSKRCKVFVKNNNKYSDLGVGTLHLKPVKDKEKTQLLVRADTSIGKILINVILSEGIPTQKKGNNNVMMICIPTPESEQKAVAVLLRVKTAEEADELLETINKYKK